MSKPKSMPKASMKHSKIIRTKVQERTMKKQTRTRTRDELATGLLMFGMIMSTITFSIYIIWG